MQLLSLEIPGPVEWYKQAWKIRDCIDWKDWKGLVVCWDVTNARFLLTGKLQERFDWLLLDWVYRQTIKQLSCLLNQWRNTLSRPTSYKSTGASGGPSCSSEFFPPRSTLLPPPSLPCTDTSSCLVTPSVSTPQTAKTPSAWRKYGQRVQSFLSKKYKMQYFFGKRGDKIWHNYRPPWPNLDQRGFENFLGTSSLGSYAGF